MIFCKPQSASAISIHFLHLFPPHVTPPKHTHTRSSDTLLTLSITSSPSLPCYQSISLSASLSLTHIFPLLYLPAYTFPRSLYRALSAQPSPLPHSGSSLFLSSLPLNTSFLQSRLRTRRRQWSSRKVGRMHEQISASSEGKDPVEKKQKLVNDPVSRIYLYFGEVESHIVPT